MSELREALRRLCSGLGWSYGVVWRVDRGNPRILVMEANYCEEQFRPLITKMFDQVHLVGEGTIGQVAATGQHQWIHSNGSSKEWSPNGTNNNPKMSQDDSKWYCQFLSGIKTLVFICLPAQGVVQFGSSQQMFEDLEFVNLVRSSFQVNGIKGPSLLGDAQKVTKIHMPHGQLRTSVSFGDWHTWFRSNNSLYDSIGKEYTEKAQSLTHLVHPSSLFSTDSYLISRCQDLDLAALPSSTSSSTYATRRNSNLFQQPNSTGNSHCFTNQSQAAVTNIQLSETILRSHSSLSNNSAGTYWNTHLWNTEVNLPVMEPRMPSGMHMQGLPSTSHVPHSSCMSAYNHFHGDSLASNGMYGSLGAKSEIGMTNTYNSEQLIDFKHVPSSFNTMEGDPFTCNSFSNINSSNPQGSQLVCSKDDLMDQNGLTYQQQELVCETSSAMVNENNAVLATSCGLDEKNSIGCGATNQPPCISVENSMASTSNSIDKLNNELENPMSLVENLLTDNDFFEGLELDLDQSTLQDWDSILTPMNSGSKSKLETAFPECISELNMSSKTGVENNSIAESGLEQLLDAMVTGHFNLASSHNYLDTKTNLIANSGSENQCSTSKIGVVSQSYQHEVPLADLSCFSQNSTVLIPDCGLGDRHVSLKESVSKSQISSWIDDSNSLNAESSVTNQLKRPERVAKVVRRRARPGESTRPRPKDRQQIQDRVKELREIVPNGAKCSIDALLDRTIKHMLYLQSITKYADKLNQADEPKVIFEESGVVLKDNTSGNGNGATWAFEVAGQTMVCPIIVEDLSPPGQMLVEMICEERGFFLEIADIIRGFGLTILKGVMEVRDSKIWARFLVEANRDLTRMDIFLSLVQFLQQTASGARAQPVDKRSCDLLNYQQSPMAIPIGVANKLQ